MYTVGHAGLTLLILSIMMLPFGYDTGKIILIVFAAGISSLPDIDLEWQKRGYPIHHRGPTHSILFALIVGILLGGLLWYGYREMSWFVIGFIAGVFGIVSHLIGDSFTYMAFKPLSPFSTKEIGFKLVSANNRIANEGFGTVGTLAFLYYILSGHGSINTFFDAFRSLIESFTA